MIKNRLLNLGLFILILSLVAISILNVSAEEEPELLNSSTDDSVLVFHISESGQVSGSVIFNIYEPRVNITPQVMILPFAIKEISNGKEDFLAGTYSADSKNSLIMWFLKPGFKGEGKIDFSIEPEEENEKMLDYANSYPDYRGFLLAKIDQQDLTFDLRWSKFETESSTAIAVYNDPTFGFKPQKIAFEKPDNVIFIDTPPDTIYQGANIREYETNDVAKKPYFKVRLKLPLTPLQGVFLEAVGLIIISILPSIITSLLQKNYSKKVPWIVFVGSIVIIFALYSVSHEYVIEKLPQIIAAIAVQVIIIIFKLKETNET